MALHSITEAVGTGSPQIVAVPPYLTRDHITVYVDFVPTTGFEWVTDQTIRLTAPLNRAIKVVRRTSPGTRLTDYQDGQGLPAGVLDVDSLQAFYMAQEAYDLALLQGSVGNIPAGTELTTGQILGLLNGQLTLSQFALSLRDKIDLIDADASVIGSPAWRVAQEAAIRAGADAATYGAAVAAVNSEATNRSAAIAVETAARIAGDTALATQVTTVAASAAGNTAAIQSEATARASGDSALASDIDTLVAYVDGLAAGGGGSSALADRVAAVEVAASALASRTGLVEAQYTVKVQARADGKRAIAGIGLNSTATASGPSQSEIILLADKLQFVPSLADVDATPFPLFTAGLVNGANTFVLSSGRIGDQVIQARMVVDGAIETRHLKVTGDTPELVPDPATQDPLQWSPAAPIVSDPEAPKGKAIEASTARLDILTASYIPIRADKTYAVSMDLKNVSGTATAYCVVAFYDAAFNLISGSSSPSGWTPGTFHYFGLAGDQPGSTFQTYTAKFGPGETRTAPAGAAYVRVGALMRFSGTGVQRLTAVRLREAVDFSVIVTGGIKADNIDARGLVIRDAAGNIIFGAGQNLDVSRVAGLGALATQSTATWAQLSDQPAGIYNSNISIAANGALSGAGGGQVTYGGLGGKAMGLIDQITGANIATYMQAAVIGSAYIANTLQSDNYVAGTSGWFIRKSDGYAEFGNVYVRGNVQATSLNGNIVATGNINTNAVSNVVGASTAAAVAYTTTETSVQSVTINTAGGAVSIAAGAYLVLTNSGGSPAGAIARTTMLLYRAGVLIATFEGPDGGTGPGSVTRNIATLPPVTDSPGSGSFTYELRLRVTTVLGSPVATGSATRRALVITELKR